MRRNHALLPVSCNRLTVKASDGKNVASPIRRYIKARSSAIPSYPVRLVGSESVGSPVSTIAAMSTKVLGSVMMKKAKATHQYSLLDALPLKSTYFCKNVVIACVKLIIAA